MKVAVLCSGLGRIRRGYERFSTDLARALDGRVELGLFGNRVSGARAFSIPCLPREGAVLGTLEPGRAYYFEQASFALAAFPAVHRFRPDLLHISDPAIANAYLRLKRVLPGNPPLLFCNSGPLLPEDCRRYDRVQEVTPHQLEVARAAGLPDWQVRLVPMGVWCDAFSPRMPASLLRTRLDLPEGLLAVSVGSLERLKGVDLLIEALGSSRLRNWSLVCLGQPTRETPRLEQRARSLGAKVFFRSVPPEAVAEHLNAADLFLLPSRNEGFGLAAIEAMSAGLPLLVSDIPPFRFTVGDASQLWPLSNPADLARRIAEFEDASLRASLGKRNQERVRANFDWPRLATAYVDLYRETISR